MTLPWRLLQDTIARRFALTIALTILVTVGLTGAVVWLAGAWALPSARDLGLLDRANDIIQMIEAAPRAGRERVADAVANPIFIVSWYPEPSAVAIALDAAAQVKSTLSPSFPATGCRGESSRSRPGGPICP